MHINKNFKRDINKKKSFSNKNTDKNNRPEYQKRSFIEDTLEEKSERLAKRLARSGISSRREAETLIIAGRVKVNGKVIDTPAFNVTNADEIMIDKELLPPIERTRLWLYHKPAGLITTHKDEEGRPTIFENLPEQLPRVISVGRLDINTEGLLLLTNDGGVARILELPETGWLRRYRVRVHGKVTQADLDKLKNGISVDGVFYAPVEALLDREQGSNAWLTISLREGKNREIKNILAALGLSVTRLIRISFGPFQLADLETGKVIEVRSRTLQDQLGTRLIKKSGANFDAPLFNQVMTVPTRAAKITNAPIKVINTGFPEDRDEKKYEWIRSSREITPNKEKFIKNKLHSDFITNNKDKHDLDKKEKNTNASYNKKVTNKKPYVIERKVRTSNVWMASDVFTRTKYKDKKPDVRWDNEDNLKNNRSRDKFSSDGRPPRAKYASDSRPPRDNFSSDGRSSQGKFSSDGRPPRAKYSSDNRPPRDNFSSEGRSSQGRFSSDGRPPRAKYSSDSRPPRDNFSSDGRSSQGKFSASNRKFKDKDFNSRNQSHSKKDNSNNELE
ncbi:pseudouridine synthase [Bartonella sp. DGB1]|uniref:pseudouridine synthase n=1 Tax=Bartonella sp. DGB1 TaxID=3239807 RepID=UPI003525EC3A